MGKCDICGEFLGESMGIFPDKSNSLRYLKAKQKAHLDCYIELCIEKKLNNMFDNYKKIKERMEKENGK